MLPMKNPYQADLPNNLRHSASLNLPFITHNEKAGRDIVIVATGPSLSKRENFEKIKKFEKLKNFDIMALKEAIRFLRDRSVRVDYSVSMDPGPRQATDMKTPRYPEINYIVASSCNPRLFFHLRNNKVFLFHSACGAEETNPTSGEVLDEAHLYAELFPGNTDVMGGGFTVLNRAVMLAQYMGYRRKFLVGADLGWRDNSSHYFEGAITLNGNWSGPDVHDSGVIDGKQWWTKQDMLASACDLALAVKKKSYHIEIIGDSLIKSLARHPDKFIMDAAHAQLPEEIKRKMSAIGTNAIQVDIKKF